MKDNLPQGWVRTPIRDLYLGLYDGPHATPKPAKSGPVFLGIKNITEDGKLDLGEIRHIAEEDFPKWTRRVVPRQGDIAFSYEATLDRYAIIPLSRTRPFWRLPGRRSSSARRKPGRSSATTLASTTSSSRSTTAPLSPSTTRTGSPSFSSPMRT